MNIKSLSLALAGLGLLCACSAPASPSTSVPTPSPTQPVGIVAERFNVPDAVLDTALGYVEEVYDQWCDPDESTLYLSNGARFDHYQIEHLERVWQYQALEGRDVDVYRLDYRLHTTDPDLIRLAGAMELDEEGWLLTTYHNATYLYFDVTEGQLEYLFMLMENDCEPGDERFTADLERQLFWLDRQDRAQELALADLQETLGRTDGIRAFTLEPYESFPDLAPGFQVLAYRARWEELWSDGAWRDADSVIVPGEAHFFLFGQREDELWLLGHREANLGETSLEKLAVEAVWELFDLEYALQPTDRPEWYGLGGPAGLDFALDAPPEVERLPHDVYQEGDYWEKRTWEGLSLECYVSLSPAQSSIISMSVTRDDFHTYRGISVGDSREAVLAAYPEAVDKENWGWEGDFLWYGPGHEGPGCYLVFYFEQDTVSRVELINMFD